MTREFTLPDVGEGVAEGELVSWLVAEGDTVTEDQPVAEVETDKALVEVPSPVNGTVRELHWEAGDVVPVGDLFVTYDVEGEAPADAGPDDEATAADSAPEETESEPTEAGGEAGDPSETGTEAGETATPSGRVFAPPSVRRLARELGVDIATVEGTGPSGRITEGDVLTAAEDDTDTAADDAAVAQTTESAAETDASGADAAGAGAAGTNAAETDAADARGAASGGPSGSSTVESADRDRTLAAPATRKLAEEEGVDIDAVPTDETREGEAFVTPEAVTEFAEAQRRAQEADAEALAADAEADRPREERKPFRGVRKTIADAMVESKYSAPHVTHHDEVDVTRLVETRERLKPVAEEQGIRLTYMPFVMKAVTAALQAFPEMNAMIDEDNEEVVVKNYYNVGVATATDVGLMVPVVEDADRKGLLQLSSEMNELVAKARERTISPDELRGSTFTITNIGGIGGEYATPILNYPEAGILAMGEIKRKPRVVVDEETGEESIEPRSVLTLSLSFDHRLIDGAVGAEFTNEVMRYLENPELLLLE